MARLQDGEIIYVITYHVSRTILVFKKNKIMVNQRRVVNLNEAKHNLKFILDQVMNHSDYTIISRQNTENAIIIP